MFKDKFEIIYLILFVFISVIRKIHTRRYGGENVKLKRGYIVDFILLIVVGVGMISPLIYIFSAWFDYANYYLPEVLRWIGVVFFLSACWLLWRTHADLGKNWTYTYGTKEDQKLVKDGVYKYIRHPMYASHILWAIAQLLIIPNWFAGYSFLVFSTLLCLYRIPREEKKMIEQFGEEYINYTKKTGYILPKLF